MQREAHENGGEIPVVPTQYVMSTSRARRSRSAKKGTDTLCGDGGAPPPSLCRACWYKSPRPLSPVPKLLCSSRRPDTRFQVGRIFGVVDYGAVDVEGIDTGVKLSEARATYWVADRSHQNGGKRYDTIDRCSSLGRLL